MVYLQDSDNAARLFALDTKGVHRLSAIKSRLLKRTVARKVSGHLGYIADKPAAVYVAGGRLWLAIEGQPWFLDELKAEVDQADAGYAVDISTPEREYRFFIDPAGFDDTTAFADVEDRSFGLWAAQIIENPERQNVLLTVLADAPLDEVPNHAKTDDHGSVDLRHPWLRPGQPPTDHGLSQEHSAE
jgi:hypothetical protein